MDIIANTFQQTFTLQWAILAIPVALLLSFLVNRVLAAGIVAFVAVAVQHLGPVLYPLFLESAAQDSMTTAATDVLSKINPLAVGLEWLAFTFLIAIFALTRQDMFRHKPDH